MFLHIYDASFLSSLSSSSSSYTTFQFMLFHRGYLLRFERSLLTVDPSIEALPYWDYAKDTETGEQPLHVIRLSLSLSVCVCVCVWWHCQFYFSSSSNTHIVLCLDLQESALKSHVTSSPIFFSVIFKDLKKQVSAVSIITRLGPDRWQRVEVVHWIPIERVIFRHCLFSHPVWIARWFHLYFTSLIFLLFGVHLSCAWTVTNGLFAYWPIAEYTDERFGPNSELAANTDNAECIKENYFVGVEADVCDKCCGRTDDCECTSTDKNTTWLRCKFICSASNICIRHNSRVSHLVLVMLMVSWNA